MNNIHKKILRDLFESVDGLYAFTFYSRYKIKPSALFEFIEKYKDDNALTFTDGKIQLTKKGENIAIKYTKSDTNSKKDRFVNIPIEFKDTRLEKNSLYLPDINWLG